MPYRCDIGEAFFFSILSNSCQSGKYWQNYYLCHIYYIVFNHRLVLFRAVAVRLVAPTFTAFLWGQKSIIVNQYVHNTKYYC